MKHRRISLQERVFQLLDQGVRQETIIRRILKEYPESQFKRDPVARIYYYRCCWKNGLKKRPSKNAA